MKIVMVGSGNTATVLSLLLKQAGHEIVQVVSRNIDHARQLAAKYNGNFDSLDAPEFAEADIYIIALNDAALDHVEKYTALRGKLVVHTAGSVSIHSLKRITGTYGVFYPLQSVSKHLDYVPEIPFLVDGNTQEIRHRILGLAKSISKLVIEAGDAERLHYHVAAVFVSNFTNHMYALAELFCKKERLEFKTLLPLINEVAARANNNSPFLTQTGPALRDDVFTLNRHLQSLTAHPDLRYVYLKLSESIIKTHKR